ncbi:MAG: hypothetical protein NC098_09535 [Lachnoclostridium sp.]|nr:hypothetical protein [Lachnoclostridium sp.]
MEDMDYMAFTNEDEIFKVLESEAAYASLSKENEREWYGCCDEFDVCRHEYRGYRKTVKADA